MTQVRDGSQPENPTSLDSLNASFYSSVEIHENLDPSIPESSIADTLIQFLPYVWTPSKTHKDNTWSIQNEENQYKNSSPFFEPTDQYQLQSRNFLHDRTQRKEACLSSQTQTTNDASNDGALHYLYHFVPLETEKRKNSQRLPRTCVKSPLHLHFANQTNSASFYSHKLNLSNRNQIPISLSNKEEVKQQRPAITSSKAIPTTRVQIRQDDAKSKMIVPSKVKVTLQAAYRPNSQRNRIPISNTPYTQRSGKRDEQPVVQSHIQNISTNQHKKVIVVSPSQQRSTSRDQPYIESFKKGCLHNSKIQTEGNCPSRNVHNDLHSKKQFLKQNAVEAVDSMRPCKRQHNIVVATSDIHAQSALLQEGRKMEKYSTRNTRIVHKIKGSAEVDPGIKTRKPFARRIDTEPTQTLQQPQRRLRTVPDSDADYNAYNKQRADRSIKQVKQLRG